MSFLHVLRIVGLLALLALVNCTPPPSASPDDLVASDGSFAVQSAGETWSLATDAPKTSEATTERTSSGARARVHLARAAMVETIERRGDAIEQMWTFDHEPAVTADGTFVVRVKTTGATFVRADAKGLVFRGKNAAFRYGLATWVDGRNRRTKVAVDHDGSDIVLRVPRALLDASVYPATLDPTVSAEANLDAPIANVPPQNAGSSPVAVTVGNHVDLAWYDPRINGIAGARLDPTTYTPVSSDATGDAFVSGTPARVVIPDFPVGLASNGTDTLLLAWTEEHLNGNYYAYAERIDDASGKVVPSDVGGIQLGTSLLNPPVVAWNGSEFLVAWRAPGASGEVDIRALRFDAVNGIHTEDGQGSIIGSVLPGDPSLGPPVVDFLVMGGGRNTSVVAWASRLYYAGIATSFASVVPGKSIPASIANVVLPAGSFPFGDGPAFVVDNGSTFLVLEYGESYGNFYGYIYPAFLQPIALDGTLGSTVQTSAFVSSYGPLPCVALDGSRIVVVNSGQVTAIDSSLATTQYSCVVGNDNPTGASCAIANNALFVASTFDWQLYNGGFAIRGYIAGQAFSLDTCTAHTPFSVESQGFNAETAPRLLATPSPSLSWIDDRSVATELSDPFLSSQTEVDQASIDPASGAILGTGVIGGTAVPITRLPQLSVLDHAVSTDGTAVLHASSGYFSATVETPPYSQPVLLSLIENPGATAQTSTVFLPSPTTQNFFTGQEATPFASFELAYGAGVYLLVTTTGTQVQASLIDPVTLAVGSTAIVSEAYGITERSHASVVFDGSQFLVVWQDARGGSDAIYAAHVTPQNVVVEPAGVRVSTSPFPQTEPAVAATEGSGGGAIVVWRDVRDESSTGDIFGHLFNAAGAPTGSDFAVAQASGDQTVPVVVDAEDGLNFQVAWTDTRTDPGGDIFGTLVGYDGTVRQPAGEAMATSSDAESAPTLAAVAPGRLLLAYVRDDTSIALGTNRIRTRVLTTGATAGKCTSDNDCATLHCSDGVCCNVACDQPCATCAGESPGICTPVYSAVDPDTCKGAESCSSTGACEKVLGQMCGAATDCVSGFCVDGVCCNDACLGGCNECNVTGSVGTCTTLRSGSSGQNPTCLPNVCDGTSVDCPTTCTGDADCVRPYTCGPEGACILLGGSSCKDDHTLQSADGTLKDCTPYACEGSICLSQCNSIEQCADGSLCDVRGVCVAASQTSTSSACDVGQAPGKSGKSGGSSRSSTALSAFLAVGIVTLFRRARRATNSR